MSSFSGVSGAVHRDCLQLLTRRCRKFEPPNFVCISAFIKGHSCYAVRALTMVTAYYTVILFQTSMLDKRSVQILFPTNLQNETIGFGVRKYCLFEEQIYSTSIEKLRSYQRYLAKPAIKSMFLLIMMTVLSSCVTSGIRQFLPSSI